MRSHDKLRCFSLLNCSFRGLVLNKSRDLAVFAPKYLKRHVSSCWIKHYKSTAAGFDLDEDELNDSGCGKQKQRGVDDTVTAARLRVQLSELLATPLSLPMNEKFFTGGTSHTGSSKSQDASEDAGAAALPTSGMQASLAQAKIISDSRKRGTKGSKQTGTELSASAVSGSSADKVNASARESSRSYTITAPAAAALRLQGKTISKNTAKKVKSMTVADYNIIALEKAVAAKRAKKGKLAAGVQTVGPRPVFGRAVHGIDALAVLKAHLK